MKDYKKPEFHFIRNPDELSGNELANCQMTSCPNISTVTVINGKNKKYRIKPGYILREIAGEYVIVPAGAESKSPLENTVMAPNGSAVFIWKHFEEPSTLEDVVVQGMLEYDVTEDRMRRSVENFVTDALNYKILEEVE